MPDEYLDFPPQQTLDDLNALAAANGIITS